MKSWFEEHEPKGEIVIIVAGATGRKHDEDHARGKYRKDKVAEDRGDNESEEI